MTATSLSEAEKMRRVPGIVFADGPVGRRARIAGTGIDVFEVIKNLRIVGDDQDKLAQGFHWLTPAQLRAALDYYQQFPDEIDERLRVEFGGTPETAAEVRRQIAALLESRRKKSK